MEEKPLTLKKKEATNKKLLVAACMIGLLWLVLTVTGVYFFN